MRWLQLSCPCSENEDNVDHPDAHPLLFVDKNALMFCSLMKGHGECKNNLGVNLSGQCCTDLHMCRCACIHTVIDKQTSGSRSKVPSRDSDLLGLPTLYFVKMSQQLYEIKENLLHKWRCASRSTAAFIAQTRYEKVSATDQEI